MTEDASFIVPLLQWFESEAADLPWRRTNDPYHIWLSEIMLQQTQVATVVPYYEGFLKRFPTVADLASAPQDDLMKLWEGLGYYSRARNLHAAAQQVVASHGGHLPRTAADLEELKGIGPYTARAIASIAFGERVPVLDGNVIRVFSRLFDIEDDVRQTATKNALWARAEALMPHVPEGRAGDYNQSLMELGRQVCKPRQPRCLQCPVAQYCKAYARGKQARRPVKTRKPPTPHYDVTCGLIWNEQNQLLITKRRDDGLLGGLWEFPGGKLEDSETLEECLARELKEELGITVEVGELFLKVRHAYTHFKITLYGFECRYFSTAQAPTCYECAEWRWVNVDELSAYAFSRADRKIIEALHERPNRLL